jgi:hydroxymethylbilane synthase
VGVTCLGAARISFRASFVNGAGNAQRRMPAVMRTIRIATRTSTLAMAQARSVLDGIRAQGRDAEILGVTTRGDREQSRSLAAIGGDGIFVKELQAALLDGRADVAVHSMKDLPTELPAELRCGAVLEREDARDVLVSRANAYANLAALPPAAVVGTSSLRRRAMVSVARPDVHIRDLRGNVDTRVRKVLQGEYTAAILALAGVKRIGLLESIGGGSPIDLDEMVPAAGQGAIYAQCRHDDAQTLAALAPLNHPPTALATAMERSLLRRMGGGCLVPIGAFAAIHEGEWRLDAVIAAMDGSATVRRSLRGKLTGEAEAIAVAHSLADEMLAAGGRELIERFRTAIAGES